MAPTARSTPSSRLYGFAVSQPALEAPLQFSPPCGSRQLNDMINALIPGPSPISHKRRDVALDFFKYAHETGQSFRYYPVRCVSSAGVSPVPASPSRDSITSSSNASPPTPSCDWRAIFVPSKASSLPRNSSQRRRGLKARGQRSGYSGSRNYDLSHYPGLRIYNKEGVDVTNTASRGSRTQEQRDHARLIRERGGACGTCKRKKIKCDRDHKRGFDEIEPPSTSKPNKKARTMPPNAPPPRSLLITGVNTDVPVPPTSSLQSGPGFPSNDVEFLNPADLALNSLDQVLQFPDTQELDALLDLNDSNDHSSMQLSASSSVASPQKSTTPLSQQDCGADPACASLDSIPQASVFRLPFMDDEFASLIDYIDFPLYSPSSDFSEDERMLSISPTNRGLPSSAEPLLSQCPPPPSAVVTSGQTMERLDPVLSFDVSLDGVGFGDLNYLHDLSDETGVWGGRDQLTTMAAVGPDGWGTPSFESRAAHPFESISMVGTTYPSDNLINLSKGTPPDGVPNHKPVGHKSSALPPDAPVGPPGLAAPGSARAPTAVIDSN
ncbi:hypothetical protein E4U54_006114, partial [Claviceps lovelessii]